jgi:hypothetical protein
VTARGTVAISLDLDWAPEEVLDDTLQLLSRHGATATVFATHDSPVLRRAGALVEVGVHPNFNPLLEGSASTPGVDEILDRLREMYPEARGLRSHSMLQSTPLLLKFVEYGFRYEANCFLPYDNRLAPRKLWMDLVRVPYNWEDDVHWSYGYAFDDFRLKMDADSLNVLDFHPIHIFLNTEDAARYAAARPFYRDPGALKSHRNRGPRPGTRDLFIQVLEWCRDGEATSVTMGSVAANEADRS